MPISLALDAIIPQPLHAKQGQCAAEVIAQHHQAELSAAFFQATHQEMLRPGAVFQRPERVLHQGRALFHRVGALPHAPLVAVNDRFVFPAFDLLGFAVFTQALAAQGHWPQTEALLL